ncbi:MAG: DsbA family protein [Myxococcota bacterium]
MHFPALTHGVALLAGAAMGATTVLFGAPPRAAALASSPSADAESTAAVELRPSPPIGAALRDHRAHDAAQQATIGGLERALQECRSTRPREMAPPREAAARDGADPDTTAADAARPGADADPVPGALPAADPELAALEPFDAANELDLPHRGRLGPRTIPVVECIDYDCPYCYRARATVARLLDNHDDVSFRVLHNPLAIHPNAAMAARAAVAAQRQDAGWPMHEALFDDRSLRTVETLSAKAESLGLDPARFARDLMSEEVGREVASQAAVCRNADARGTPTFFVGGDLVMGAQGYATLVEAVESERQEQR